MSIELIGYTDVRYNKKRDEIRCRLCGSRDTHIQSDGNPIWSRDRNAKGEWTSQFLCYKCNYTEEKTCYICGCDQILNKQMFRYYNIEGIWIGKYICNDCYNKKRENYKNNNINITVGKGNGSILDMIVAAVLEIPTCSIYIADKRLPFSLIHGYYGIIGIKISKLKYDNLYFNVNDKISADTYFCIGFDKELKNIVTVHVVPTEEKGNGRLSITKNSRKYKMFEVEHEPYNNIYHSVNMVQ